MSSPRVVTCLHLRPLLQRPQKGRPWWLLPPRCTKIALQVTHKRWKEMRKDKLQWTAERPCTSTTQVISSCKGSCERAESQKNQMLCVVLHFRACVTGDKKKDSSGVLKANSGPACTACIFISVTLSPAWFYYEMWHYCGASSRVALLLLCPSSVLNWYVQSTGDYK